MSASFRITGVEKLEAALRASGRRANALGASALYEEAELVMGDAKEQTPVDTGALRASGHVAQPTTTGDRSVVEMGFGGAAAPYAVIVHEDLSAAHAPGTNAKYLERPLLAAVRGMASRMAKRIRSGMGR